MIHLGDITQISGYTAPPVEVIIGGSPCQDLSVAGKRAGLQGERSGLFMEQIRIIKEMRENDKRNGRTAQYVRPRFMVWENVPGAFSSAKGEDFRAVLEETARIVEENAVIPRPPNGKWTNAGCIMGDGWSIAWRVLDAQFWGVPQRRRRIALVADFGGYAAPEVLFEREGVSGDPSESGTAREGTAGDAKGSVGTAISFVNRGHYRTDEVSETLRSECHQDIPCVCAGFKLGNSEKARSIGWEEEKSPTLNAENGGNKPAICIQGNCIDHADTAGCNGRGWRDDDVSYTLNTIDRPAVYDARGNGDGQTAPTLTGDHQNRVTDYTAVCIGNGQGDQTWMSDKVGTLNCMHDQQAVMVCGVDCLNGVEFAEKTGTLVRKQTLNNQGVVRESCSVRRLTPLECERLQGYPDGWTDIGKWVNSKGKTRKTSDSARYKALGNSIALPPWRFVLSRIQPYLVEHTMASLFDGIGGFPLIWRELNGDGMCLWASEIEEFPIAATKRRIG